MKSVLTEYTDVSAFSGRPAEACHHLIYGEALRALADEDGLVLPLTNDEHNMSARGVSCQIHGNPAAEKLSKFLGQVAWEKEYYRRKAGCGNDEAREEFRRRYGKSYL